MADLKEMWGYAIVRNKMAELIAMGCRSRFREIRHAHGTEIIQSLLLDMRLWTVWMFGPTHSYPP